MGRKVILSVLYFVINLTLIIAQENKSFYWMSGGEVILSFAQLNLTNEYALANPIASVENTAPRLTLFIHIEESVHHDFTNKFGFYSGFGIHNIGIISNETLPNPEIANESFDVKVIRRAYTFNVPLALKIGDFNKNSFMYVGGEIEFPFHYKEKYWLGFDRSGEKSKYSQWFSNQVENVLVSAMLGFQLKNNSNIKIKYYFTNFLNTGFDGYGSGAKSVISDLTKYDNNHIIYISFSQIIRYKDVFKDKKEERQFFTNL